jgi:TolB protein
MKMKNQYSVKVLLPLVLLFMVACTITSKSSPAENLPPIGGSSGWIGFVSKRDGSPHIYLIHADDSGQMRLIDQKADDEDLVFSPDGKKIAFASQRDGNIEIYVMNNDGTGQVNLTHNPAPDTEPAWSPDGTKIAFTSGRDEQEGGEIYIMNADGSQPTRLTNSPGYDYAACWQPGAP